MLDARQCSIRLLKWPDSMQIELWEKGTFRDSLVAEFYVAVPGLGGSPHVDPQPKPYSWTSAKPVPHNRLLQAVASMEPLGVLPAAQMVMQSGQQQQLQLHPDPDPARSAGDPSDAAPSTRAAAALDTGDSGETSNSLAAGSASSQSRQHGNNRNVHSEETRPTSANSLSAMYPSGVLFVRCGWVADSGIEPQFTPFQHTDGAFGVGQAKDTALQHSLRVPHTSSFGEDGTVQISVAGRGTAALPAGRQPASPHGSPSKQQVSTGFMSTTASYTNPLAFAGPASAAGGSRSSPRGSPSKAGRAGSTAADADVLFSSNPLAYLQLGEDVEVGQMLTPPMLSTKADRALQRVAHGVGHKAS